MDAPSEAKAQTGLREARAREGEASIEDRRNVSAELQLGLRPIGLALRATPPLRGGESLSEDYLDRRAEPANNPRLTSNPNAKFRKSEDVYAYSNSEDMGCSRTLHGAAADRSGPSPVRHRHI
ncbi:MAG: hypothetical protein DMG16_15800 [Acidobacteria bacterium]|nr:MAG: hypothetical protein DMG16_15800 [Acidobacteriota bacterium]